MHPIKTKIIKFSVHNNGSAQPFLPFVLLLNNFYSEWDKVKPDV